MLPVIRKDIDTLRLCMFVALMTRNDERVKEIVAELEILADIPAGAARE